MVLVSVVASVVGPNPLVVLVAVLVVTVDRVDKVVGWDGTALGALLAVLVDNRYMWVVQSGLPILEDSVHH